MLIVSSGSNKRGRLKLEIVHIIPEAPQKHTWGVQRVIVTLWQMIDFDGDRQCSPIVWGDAWF